MDEKLIEQVISEYWQEDKICLFIPKNTFNCEHIKLTCLYVELMALSLQKKTNVEWKYILCYDSDKIFLFREDFVMKATYTVRIPYDERSKYYDTIEKINGLVDPNGACILCINNVPYKLDCIFVIETETSIDEIYSIIQQKNLEVILDKGLKELMQEMTNRKWDIIVLPFNNENLSDLFKDRFYFAEKKSFRDRGYDVDVEIKRKKLFISYCHKDKSLVHNIVGKFKQLGLYVWIDEEEIDLGESLLTCIGDGIKECDLGVIFLSSNTLSAKMAKFELNAFLKKLIYGEKKMAVVILDDINPDEVVEGLSLYNYFSYFDNPDVEKLVKLLQRKIEKLK